MVEIHLYTPEIHNHEHTQTHKGVLQEMDSKHLSASCLVSLREFQPSDWQVRSPQVESYNTAVLVQMLERHNLLFMAVYSALASLRCSHSAEFWIGPRCCWVKLGGALFATEDVYKLCSFPLSHFHSLPYFFKGPWLKLNLFRSFRLLNSLFLLSKLSLSSPRLLFHLFFLPSLLPLVSCSPSFPCCLFFSGSLHIHFST